MNFGQPFDFFKWHFKHILKQLFINVNNRIKVPLVHNIYKFLLKSPSEQDRLFCDELSLVILRFMLRCDLFLRIFLLLFWWHFTLLIHKLLKIIGSQYILLLRFCYLDFLFAKFSCC